MVKNLFKNSQRLFERQQTNILSAATIITAAGLLSALLGLLRNRLLVTYFFETPKLQAQLDAYWVAFRLPELVFQLLVIGALSAAFIPVFSKYLQVSKEKAYELSSSMMNLVLLVFFGLSVIILVLAKQLNQVITSANFTPEQVKLAADLSRIMLLAQFFFAVSNFLTGMIQAQRRFLVPALSPLAYNLGIIAGIVILSPIIGIFGPAVGVVFGAWLHLLLQLPLARRLGFSYQPIIKLGHPGVKEMLRLMLPRTLAISVSQIELFAVVYFATALSAGSLTIINLAQQLMSAPIRVFSVPVGQASLPFLSQETAKNQLVKFKSTFLNSLKQILFLALPASALLIVLRIPLVRLAYGASEFPWSATVLTSKAVAILAVSIFAQGAIHILVRSFYALHNTKTPFLIGLAAVIINIVLAAIAVLKLKAGVIGLAMAMSVAGIFQGLVLMVALVNRLGGLPIRKILVPILKMGIATLVMGIFLWMPMRLLDQFVFDTTRTLPLIGLTTVAGCLGIGVYLMLSWLLGIKELDIYFNLLKRLGNWRRVLEETDEVIAAETSQAQESKPL